MHRPGGQIRRAELGGAIAKRASIAPKFPEVIKRLSRFGARVFNAGDGASEYLCKLFQLNKRYLGD